MNVRLWLVVALTAVALGACGKSSEVPVDAVANQGAASSALVPASAVGMQVNTVNSTAPSRESPASLCCVTWQQRQSDTVASFNNPEEVTSDGHNLYVVDTGNNLIRKIDITGGLVTTLAGSGRKGAADGSGPAASFNKPGGVATDGKSLFVADSFNNKIRMVDIATGAVSTLAGSGNAGAKDGIGSAAEFNFPKGIATDGSNLYVADFQNREIRKIAIATGKVTTLAGAAEQRDGFLKDGIGSAARFLQPSAITTDGKTLYVLDAGNRNIRRIVIATGEVTTLPPKLTWPRGISIAGQYLFVSDEFFNTIQRIDITTGQMTNLAGPGEQDTQGFADGAGIAALFFKPAGMAADGGNLFVADSHNNKIREIRIASGQVFTLAGLDEEGDSDGATAALYLPSGGLATDGAKLYISEYSNNTIQQIDLPTGTVSTLAGTGRPDTTGGISTAAAFNYPQGIVSDQGILYVADYANHTIRKVVAATGEVATVAGSEQPGRADGTGTRASFNFPRGIASDGRNLYVADYDNNQIRQIVIATGKVTTLAGSGNAGTKDGIGTAASFNHPRSIACDGANIYVADTYNHSIRKIDVATGSVTTLVGSGRKGAADGAGRAASFSYPQGMAIIKGNLYVADYGNHTIRKIVLGTATVSTLAGSGKAGAKDGMAREASFNQPAGLATDGKNLYVADSGYRTIRRIEIATGAVSTLVAPR